MNVDESQALDVGGDTGPFRYLFENVQDAVVAFELEDGEPIVSLVNDSFCETFGVMHEEVVGSSLNDLIVPTGRMPESDRFDRRTAAGKPNYAIVDRLTEDGLKTLLYRGIPYDDGDRGFALYTDLTDEIRRERELAVLNRVLRYNLSEEVASLVEHAEHLAEEVEDPDLVDSAREVRTSTLALDRMVEEASDLEDVLDADPELDAVALADAVDAALDDVPLVDYADVTVDLGDVPPVRSGGHLDRAIAALVDNAIRHTDAQTPTVRVSAEHDDGVVSLTVRDRGPGLPAQERRLLTGDVEVTPLDHGSGLGLWLVRWITTAYDGDVTYEERENGGSAITLELAPARD